MTDPMRTSSQWCLKSIALLTAAAKARQKKLIWIAATMKVLEMRGWTYIAEMKIKLRGFMPTTHAYGEDRNLSLEVQDAPGGCREGVARVTRHEALALILQFSLHVLFVEYLLTRKKLVERSWHISIIPGYLSNISMVLPSNFRCNGSQWCKEVVYPRCSWSQTMWDCRRWRSWAAVCHKWPFKRHT